MPSAKLFKNGRSQAVRLPKAYRFEGEAVEIRPWGDGVLLLPIKKDHPWKNTREVAEEAASYPEITPPTEQKRDLSW